MPYDETTKVRKGDDFIHHKIQSPSDLTDCIDLINMTDLLGRNMNFFLNIII